VDSDPNLSLVQQPALPPPEVHIDIEHQRQQEALIEQAAHVELPQNEDDEEFK
jgi:GTP-binding nuclear protein Ran